MLRIHAQNRIQEYDMRARYCRDDYQMAGRGRLDTEFRITGIISKVRFERGDRVLDIGPGDGHLFERIHLRVRECHGVDPSAAMVQRLRKKFNRCENVAFRCAPSSKLPFPDQYFDRILMNDVVGYLNNRKEVLDTLAEIRRVAKDGATVFIGGVSFLDEVPGTPRAQAPWERINRHLHAEGFGGCVRSIGVNMARNVRVLLERELLVVPPEHRIFFHEDTFLRMGRRMGLEGRAFRTESLYGPLPRNDYLFHPVPVAAPPRMKESSS